MTHDDREYHEKRAMQELNLGLAATNILAARSHLQLSSLHLQQADAKGLPTDRIARRPPVTM